MPTTFQSLGLDKLTRDEKIAIVDDLTDEIEETTSQSSCLTIAQREELRSRIADMDANTGTSIPWEDVESVIRRRFGS